MDSMNPRVRVVVGLLIALSGASGFAAYDSAWLKALFALVILSGLWNAAMGAQRRGAGGGT